MYSKFKDDDIIFILVIIGLTILRNIIILKRHSYILLMEYFDKNGTRQNDYKIDRQIQNRDRKKFDIKNIFIYQEGLSISLVWEVVAINRNICTLGRVHIGIRQIGDMQQIKLTFKTFLTEKEF